MIICYW